MRVLPATPGYIIALIVVFGVVIFLSFLSRYRNKQRTHEDNSTPASKLPDENNDSKPDEH